LFSQVLQPPFPNRVSLLVSASRFSSAGCWLNGSKLQDNEQKKKVRPARTVHRMRFPVLPLTAFAQELRRLGGRAAQ
jgi:hypothetical protein